MWSGHKLLGAASYLDIPILKQAKAESARLQ